MARRYELPSDVALAHGIPPYLISEVDYHQEMESAQALIKRHEEKLAMCYRASLGLSVSTEADWSLAQDAVREVGKLRFDYDNLCRSYEDVKREFTTLREKVLALDEKYSGILE